MLSEKIKNNFKFKIQKIIYYSLNFKIIFILMYFTKIFLQNYVRGIQNYPTSVNIIINIYRYLYKNAHSITSYYYLCLAINIFLISMIFLLYNRKNFVKYLSNNIFNLWYIGLFNGLLLVFFTISLSKMWSIIIGMSLAALAVCSCASILPICYLSILLINVYNLFILIIERQLLQNMKCSCSNLPLIPMIYYFIVVLLLHNIYQFLIVNKIKLYAKTINRNLSLSYVFSSIKMNINVILSLFFIGSGIITYFSKSIMMYFKYPVFLILIGILYFIHTMVHNYIILLVNHVDHNAIAVYIQNNFMLNFLSNVVNINILNLSKVSNIYNIDNLTYDVNYICNTKHCSIPIILQEEPTEFINHDKNTNNIEKGNTSFIEINKNRPLNIQNMILPLSLLQDLNIINDHNTQKTLVYKIRDWCISRQRYWGCPIPIVYCKTCGIVLDKNLPICLPDFYDNNIAGNSLNHIPSWKNVNCPQCQQIANRETDTMDTFVDSSWYFMRFPCIMQENSDQQELNEGKKILPVDIYIGGIEHAVMHLIYARVINMMLGDLDMVDIEEPFIHLIAQGMVCSPYYVDSNNNYYNSNELTEIKNQYFLKSNQSIEVYKKESVKMSKSLKNTIAPDDIVNQYGAEVLKFFIMSDYPVEKDFNWNEKGLLGAHRFINRIWRLGLKLKSYQGDKNQQNNELEAQFQQQIKDLDFAMENIHFNIYTSKLRIMVNLIEDGIKEKLNHFILLKYFEIFLRALWPICFMLSSELYEQLFNKKIMNQPWIITE